MFDVVPLYNFGLPDLSQFAPDVRYESERRFDPAANRRFSTTTFHTPKGDLVSTAIEDEWKGSCCTKYLITDEEELDILEYYLDQLLQEGDFSPISASIREMRQVIGEDQALDIQWAMQPYELLCFPNTMDTAVFALTCPETFHRLMDKILRLDEKLLPVVAAGGADFVFLGGPGSEMISPQYYEDFLVPYSQIITQMAHQNGLLVYTHICSPIEPMLSKGYYNQMGIDLFETLSEAPGREREEHRGCLLQAGPGHLHPGETSAWTGCWKPPRRRSGSRACTFWRWRKEWAASTSWGPATTCSTRPPWKT